jgi:GGDEF domain-containing protein
VLPISQLMKSAPMISIRESVAELDRAERLRLTTLECYAGAIRSVSQYSVGLDEPSMAAHQRHLEALANEVSSDRPDALHESQATLRGLLRDYRDKVREFIAGLRKELENTAGAMQLIMETLAHSDGDHEGRMDASLKRLREISTSRECGSAGPAILKVTEAVQQTVEEMKNQHRLTVSQFQVEVRMLHQRIDNLERSAMMDAATRLFNRSEMESQILGATERNFTLLLIRARGIQIAGRVYDAAVAAELMAAVGKRLRNCLPGNAVIGAWGEERFIALVEYSKRDAVLLARRIAEDLSGQYSCLRDGKTVHPALQVNVGVVERETGEAPERALARAQELFAR